MRLIYSKVESNRLLHIVNKIGDFYTTKDNHRRDIVGPDEFIQLCSLNMNKGHTFKPHQHIWKDGEDKVITQESWVIIKGRVECNFYDIDGTLLEKPILEAGDCSVTLAGGHTYVILEDDTLVYEYKTGPYRGQKADKIFIGELK